MSLLVMPGLVPDFGVLFFTQMPEFAGFAT
jgi:hypothetical protein